MKKYCSNPFNYTRRQSKEIQVGNTPMGGGCPIRIQSMTNTNTLDTEACVAQSIRIIEAGCEYVRLTAQGVREAENLKNIHALLREKGYNTPLVADIHFNPKAAEVAALYVEKVRVNPGNFVATAIDGEASGVDEFQKVKAKIISLIDICKAHNTALRVGVNHGSLSERIMAKYGDTPQGMVASAMEFLRVCKEENFPHVVISMKASNTLVMAQSVRLLVVAMNDEGMDYPLHLGVTEAGDGEDGRVKSAVGIGALLADGIGDTIRVSLSEDPELEIPVAKKLVDYIGLRANHNEIKATAFEGFNPFAYARRATHEVRNIGGAHVPVVIAAANDSYTLLPDYILGKCVIPYQTFVPTPNVHPCYKASEIDALLASDEKVKFWELSYPDLNKQVLDTLKESREIVVLLTSTHANPVGETRAFFHALMSEGITTPVVLCHTYNTNDVEALQVQAGADFGALLLDGFGDGILIRNTGNISNDQLLSTAFGILQAARVRVSKTEYISCPSCGRTLFDLQTTIARIKEKTAHLKGLKIGIMGCIVNGPGEMADADYGYVGAAAGKVNLYKKQTCVEKSIPAEEAVDKLIELIKENGDWVEKK
ncbi:MAG: 4-hydroxy-3-methylbut-2-en-1-yl diphosphate synthase [Paludibacteraceae bacterium]|nr:4-hydroxy-3-methylbut-2-en-1-yl diphosphate synthase [Paludibacteraceae bacterium]